jgi:hypothetical protein
MARTGKETSILSTSKRNTKASETTRATQIFAGFEKHLATVTSLTLASVAYTPAQVTAALQLLVSLYADVNTAKSVWKAKLAAEAAQAPALLSLMAALVSYVKLTYSESPDVLADFGLPPKTVKTPLTTEQQAAAVAKRKATRAARGTKGSKARLEVKGNVTGVVVTPVTASSPASPPAAPSTPANGGSATGSTASHSA